MAKYNRILSEPIFLVDVANLRPMKEITPLFALFIWSKKEASFVDSILLTDLVNDALECYLRKMLSACATSIYFPAHQRDSWTHPRRLRSLLSPLAKTKLRFVDTKSIIWKSITKYFEPLVRDFKLEDENKNKQSYDLFNKVAWDLYRLALSVRNQTELHLEPKNTLSTIKDLSQNNALKRESLLRLSVIEGIFALFSKKDDISGFRFILGPRHNIRDRIDEILADAYLCEASALRRFFSFKTGVAGTKRDLKKLLHFIARERKWAKGILKVVSQVTFLPSESTSLIEQLAKAIPEIGQESFSPLIACPDEVYEEKRYYVIKGQRDIMNNGLWSVKGHLDKDVHSLNLMVLETYSNIRQLLENGRITEPLWRDIETDLKKGLIAYSRDDFLTSTDHFLRLVRRLLSFIGEEETISITEPLKPFYAAVHSIIPTQPLVPFFDAENDAITNHEESP